MAQGTVRFTRTSRSKRKLVIPEIIGYSRDFAPAASYTGAVTEMTTAETLVTVDNWLQVLLFVTHDSLNNPDDDLFQPWDLTKFVLWPVDSEDAAARSVLFKENTPSRQFRSRHMVQLSKATMRKVVSSLMELLHEGLVSARRG